MFEACAKAWDDLCCPDRGRRVTAASKGRVNIIPPPKRGCTEDSDSLARELLKELGMMPNWSFLNCYDSSDGSSPEPERGMPPVGPSPPVTQSPTTSTLRCDFYP